MADYFQKHSLILPRNSRQNFFRGPSLCCLPFSLPFVFFRLNKEIVLAGLEFFLVYINMPGCSIWAQRAVGTCCSYWIVWGQFRWPQKWLHLFKYFSADIQFKYFVSDILQVNTRSLKLRIQQTKKTSRCEQLCDNRASWGAKCEFRRLSVSKLELTWLKAWFREYSRPTKLNPPLARYMIFWSFRSHSMIFFPFKPLVSVYLKVL